MIHKRWHQAMCCAAVVRRLLAIVHAVVAQDGSHSKPVVVEDILTTVRLHATMDLPIAESVNRRFVPPDRQCQQFPWAGNALETFNGNESVRLLKLWC